MLSLPFETRRSIRVQRPLNEVFDFVGDFKNWRTWSPWLCQEPSCPVEIRGEAGKPGHSQSWDGQYIGSGSMTLSTLRAREQLEYALEFIKPWKSSSKAGFEFRDLGQATEVTWWMKGTLPVFLFFMKKMMVAFIGSDYERGLGMMKEHLETGTVPSKVEHKGTVDRPGFYFAGKRRRCGTKELGMAMKDDFEELRRLIASGALPASTAAFSFYHSYDMVQGTCEYTSGFIYGSLPNVPSGLESGAVPAHRAVRVDHVGSYRHLGNAWSALNSCSRAGGRKTKPLKSIPMYEVYANDAAVVPERELRTELYSPIR